jgi:LysR family transcriptional regulator, glycine cleavage system transcriptional activator
MRSHYVPNPAAVFEQRCPIGELMTAKVLRLRHEQRDPSIRASRCNDPAGKAGEGPGKALRLPPLDSLRAFEACARRLNFTEAAAELHVTQGAVSQRIKALEQILHIQLFRRLARRLELTRDGERLARGVRDGLTHIVDALAEINCRSETGTLTISVLPSFARRWLMHRLPRFHAIHREVELQVLAQGRLVDLNLTGLDAAIRFGHGKYPGLQTTYLMADSVVPVCSPQLIAQYPKIRTIKDLIALPLLHDTPTETDHSGSDWMSWLAHVGSPPMRLNLGQRYDQADLLIEAAVLGLGVALARTSLIGDDIAAGRLVCPIPQMAPTAYCYYFVCRSDCSLRASHFRDWLMNEASSANKPPISAA